MTGETPLDYKLDSMHEKAMMGHFDTHDIYWLIAAYRQLISEHDEVVLKQARVEFENATLRRQLADAQAQLGTDPIVPMLQRIKAAVDSILVDLSLNPEEFNGPINWGDLYAASVSFRIDDDGRTSTVVEIEEAAPGCEKLCTVVSMRLAMMGWQGVTVVTEW